MNKLGYALKMIDYHSRLLIKWTKYIQKHNKKQKNVVEVPKGQITIFDLEKEGKQI